MQEILKIDLPTDKPTDLELITFIETLVTIRNLLNETIIQIEIIEKLINSNSTDNNGSDDSSLNSDGVFVKLIPTVTTPKNKRK